MSVTLDVDPYLPNAYSKTRCRFDLTSYQAHLESSQDEPGKKQEVPEIIADELVLKKNERKGWELDVRGQVSTKKWLGNYGLKRNKLDMKNLMETVGFKKRDDYDYALLKPIPSKYTVGKGFLDKWTPDGKTTNVSISKEKMKQIASRLKQALTLFRRRMDWLTSESRRIFGVIQESVVIIILDVKTMSPQQFDQYRCAVERVLKEQVANAAKFNLFRAAEDLQQYSEECQPVTQKAIDEAVNWLWTLDRTKPVGQVSCCEAVMKALDDPQAQGIYLFTMGQSAESSLELLLSSCRNARKPLNVISYNCTSSEVMKSLKSVAELTSGRFHAYGVIMEMESFDALPLKDDSNRAHVAARKRTIGGVPSGAGVRPDVLKLFEEIEEAQSSLAQMESLLANMPDSKQTPYKKELSSGKNNMSRHIDRAEEYMGSANWVRVNGLKVKRLTFHDLLGKVAFRHCDGVVNVKKAPAADEYRTDAHSVDKLINARYCDQFAHVKWKDGTLVHVQITPEVHRVYEEQVSGILNKIHTRINWLHQGSRQLFGTIIERRLYIIIDTSGSMAPSIQFVKDKLFLLLQEQIRHKDCFNIISFGTKVTPWRDRLVDVSEDNLKLAWTWIRNLECDGSTNTLGAIKYALADPSTEGIYFLSDGRPDHPPKSVLAQVTLQKSVPIHSISFNCADAEANKFLCQMAKDTGGRYHYFSEHGADIEGPQPYQSEDIRLLNDELELGEHYLTKVTALRDECQELQWKRSANCKFPVTMSRLSQGTSLSLSRPKSAMVSLRPTPSDTPRRPQSSRGRLTTSHSAPVLHTAHHVEPGIGSYNRGGVSQSASFQRMSKPSKKPGVAAHTRTSLLRTLSASSDWVLPETKSMLHRQYKATKSPRPKSSTPRQPSPPVIEKPSSPPMTRSTNQGKKKKAKFLASKNWLLKHGLRAKKLLLLDALTDAIQKDRTTTKLDTTIVSRLLDEDMSDQHQGNKDTLMSNPYLEETLLEYEGKLEKALQFYKRRLDRLVWENLPKSEQDKYRDSDAEDDDTRSVKMRSFLDNKSELMRSLDNCGWPVTQNDVLLMEEEIKQAESYLQQSSKIREASDGYETRARQQPAAAQVRQPKMRGTIPDQLRGQKVVARKTDDGLYYSGLVLRSRGAHHALVQFDSGEEQSVSKQFVIPTKGAIAVPTLLMGDYVLVMVKGTDDMPCYVPGQVELTPKQSPQGNGKFYEVTVYNGSRVSSLRSSIVKIGKARYNFSVAYIKERSNDGEHENDGGDNSDDEVNHDVASRRDVTETLSKYHHILEKIIEKQQDCKSKQQRMQRQMKKIHKEYKTLKDTNKEAIDSRKHIRFHSLDGIEAGEEVLARWLDEGWYYRCQVQRRVSERTYMLQDSCGDLQQTSRDDIITDNDDITTKVDEDSPVIALHPNYYYSYAPAIVDEVFDDYSCSVTFYDGTRSIAEREDIFLTDHDSYDRDVAYIHKCEDELVDQAVVARDNSSGEYRLGTIVSNCGSRQYYVEFSDGRNVKQSSIHIFGVFSKQYRFNVGDHCLSVSDEKQLTYLPGVVSAKTKSSIDVTFVDGSKVQNVQSLKSFWISQGYYEAAETYFNNRNKPRRAALAKTKTAPARSETPPSTAKSPPPSRAKSPSRRSDSPPAQRETVRSDSPTLDSPRSDRSRSGSSRTTSPRSDRD